MSNRGFSMSASALRDLTRSNPDVLRRNPHLAPHAPPTAPLQERPLPATDAEDLLLAAVQALAKAHSWHGEHSVHARDGVRCTLWRGRDLLMAQLLGEGQALNTQQRAWQEGLEATGKVEVYIWRPTSLHAVRARLSAEEDL